VLVFLLPNTSYRIDDFLAAAARAGTEVLIASDRCHQLDGVYRWPERSIVVDYRDPAAAAATVVDTIRARGLRPAAVVPLEGETPAMVAAMVSAELGLPANPVEAARAARDKRRMRTLCAAAGVPVPAYRVVPIASAPPADLAYPCVLKPTFLSASRGVIRADDPEAYVRARDRIARFLARPAIRAVEPDAAEKILVEAFIPGPEVAVEGILEDGRLRVLCIFDKPDPLDGPFFEETLYVTPSRLPPAAQDGLAAATAAAVRALGLVSGPIHAELRLSPGGPVVIEVAARSIGGLCGRTLRFGLGLSLEDVIVRHALGRPLAIDRPARAAGAMMLPIPSAGVLRHVSGIDEARAVPGVEDLAITTPLDKELEPLPEGGAYLGFLLASGSSPEAVEASLREAHRRLGFVITPTLPLSG